MKYLFLFLLLSTTVFSQNFHYAVDERSGTATSDITAPTNPLNLVASNISNTTATLSWTAATDDAGIADYRIYNNDDLLFESTGGPVTTFILTGLTPSVNYNLTLRALDAAGNESENSNALTITTVEHTANITRFIMIGASVIRNSFYNPSQTISLINDKYPSEKVELYNEAVNGATSTAMAGYRLHDILDKYSYDNNKDTYVVIHIGGNDVTQTRPYATATSDAKTALSNNITYILNAIEAKGFTPILSMISFRNYDNTTYDNEENGSLPYNENIIKPLILSRTPKFAYADGTSFFQPYELYYNNYQTYLHEDNIHPTGSGEGALRNHFVSTICKYIFEGVPPTKVIKNAAFEPSANLPDEIAALENAYYLPISQKANLQSALNTYNEVRLGKGDYSGTAITMSGNMKLYGHPSITTVPTINVNSSNGLHIESVKPNGINIASGQTVKNSKFVSITLSIIKSTGGIIENNTFLDLSRTRINWNMSDSGYFRNNKIIRFWAHAHSDQLVMKANAYTPSYGNTFLFTNLLTPGGNTMDLSGHQDFIMAGIDAETWNFNGTGTRAAFYMRDMGNVKIALPNGGNNGSYKTPAFDIGADNLLILGKRISAGSGHPSIARANTNVLMINSNNDPYSLESGTGFDFRAFFNNTNVTLNGVSNIISLITGDTNTKLTNMILDDEKKPWDRPIYETLPNPTGSDWTTNRVGQTDSAPYIQGLINANGIAELDEGIYYIGSTLNMVEGQGIVGKGTGKTVIVGLNDKFPLVKVKGKNTNGFTLAHMTLQGGSTGLEITRNGNVQFQVNNTHMKYLVFRNQNYGIHLYECWGLDNNFINNVSFVNCNVGFKQTPEPNYTGGHTWLMTYVDKTLFYKSQVINCNTGFDMRTARANNLNAWIDCKFQNNNVAANMTNNKSPFFANCDFTGHKGGYVVKAYSTPAFYSCNFSGNSTTSILDSNSPYIEGSNFLDNIPVFASDSTDGYILNSTFIGDIGNFKQGMIINSNVRSNPSLNKLMVKVVSGKPTTLLDDEPKPYPQLLVTH